MRQGRDPLAGMMPRQLTTEERTLEAIERLEKTVNRLVVAIERTLASDQAIKDRAERVLGNYDVGSIQADIAQRINRTPR